MEENEEVVTYTQTRESASAWDSDLVIFRPYIILQDGVEQTIMSTQRQHRSYEFSMLFKGEWHENGFWYVYNDYIIPEQLTERASVEFQESVAELRNQQGFNTVAHSHPFSQDSYFSAPDEETINSHFPCSLLSNNKGRVIRGNLLIDMQRIVPNLEPAEVMEKLSIPVEGENIDTLVPSVDVAGIDNIKRKPIPIRSDIIERGDNGNGDTQSTNGRVRGRTGGRLQPQS